MANETFTDVAGQTITINRPPRGYVMIVDTDGNHAPVARTFLDTDPEAWALVCAWLDKDD